MLVWLGIIAALMLRPRPPATIEGRARSFCWHVANASFLGMQADVDSHWIHVDDDEDGYLTDRRTGFRRSMGTILDLAKHCETRATHLPDGIVVEQLCDVVFLLSPDWKIRAIMDEATWKSRGDEILIEIREELRRSEQTTPSAGEGPGADV